MTTTTAEWQKAAEVAGRFPGYLVWTARSSRALRVTSAVPAAC